MQKILIIEDEAAVQLLLRGLLGHRFHLISATTAAAAVTSLQTHIPDLVLLDVSLPDADGFRLFSRLRTLPVLKGVPIVFMTGKSGVNDRVAGFSLGADDYIVKPFEPLEFRARVEAKLNARLSQKQARDTISRGRLQLDRAMFKAFTHDESGHTRDLELTPHEFRLLTHFLAHEGHVLSRDQLMTAVWGGDTHVLERTIDRHVSTLRKKLCADYEKIETVAGVGYRFSISHDAHKVAA